MFLSFLRFFADCLSFMPNKAKNSTFLPNFQIFNLIWHVIHKICKNSQKWENATSNGILKSKKEFKINFGNFCLFFAYFEQKVAKNMFFVIFSKMVIFSQNLTLPMCSL